ncbi:sigma-E factor negative regulatory protein [Aliikangiella coralliicola]|uniref:Anti sigma-E protein RseA N-terminal domain-containing protein n=1 Tax=Aliikangiella coralliicola TaxID=2592383 RepID=A0A545U689_9GAMM|nr:RseA family anti-sigma factor [Aliikangiella coralliicola]TQV84991.1 hypothetical protein FLL46_21620 [Aliikangiella coralliicola]
MSNDKLNKNQHLSDLMDDKPSNLAIDELLGDDEKAETWFRYQTVRSVLNDEHSAFSSYEFTQAISAKIADEPAIIARPDVSKNTTNYDDVLPQPAATAHVISRSWRRAGGGLAIAASVAFAMVFSVQVNNNSSSSSAPGLANTQSESSTAAENNIAHATVSPSDDAEQAKLDAIQRILEGVNRPDVNEQLVSGEVMVQSYIVKTNDPVSQFVQEVRSMKKPSEVKKASKTNEKKQ